MPQAWDVQNLNYNLGELARLKDSPRGSKLSFDVTSGQFTVQRPGIGTSLARTFSSDSVKSERYFIDPIKGLLCAAAKQAGQTMKDAGLGLERLRATYSGDVERLGVVDSLLQLHKLLSALKKQPINLAPELEAFLKKIFDTPELMNGMGKDLDDNIYRLYYRWQGQRNDMDLESQMRWVVDYWNSIRGKLMDIRPFLQGANVRLEDFVRQVQDMIAAKGLCDPQKFARRLQAFIYFQVKPGGAQFRVYANPLPHAAEAVTRLLLDRVALERSHGVKGYEHGITAFKIAGPVEFLRRADTMVIYCQSQEYAEQLAKELAQHRNLFGGRTPAMTKKLEPDLGLGIGAEPVQHANEKQYSFGTVRAAMIGRAIQKYNQNRLAFSMLNVFERYDMFKLFVADAFQDHNIDPNHVERNWNGNEEPLALTGVPRRNSV